MENGADLGLVQTIREAVKEYNKYRSPESTAIVLEMKEDTLTIEFEGSYCETCGLNDWILDFKYVLEEHGVQAEVIGIKGDEDDIWNISERRIGVFRIKIPPQVTQGGKASQLKPSS
ncbi:MAG: hypothetical protein F7B59_04395 [Desulfurococcales archaeon]|nr:hypothetical protein [Desulfurococcales archaeon]